MNQISLAELNRIIRNCLDASLDPSYWVIAEISELKVNQKGHCYLELIEKSEDEILAKARATIWSYAYRNLSTWFEGITGESLRPGLKILANVTVSFHEIYGLSLNIRDIDASFTVGERALRRQEIMKKLRDDGVAEMNKEIPLPLVPQRVAVISSPTAAGYQDFTDQLDGNSFNYQFNLRLFPAIMQGNEAESSIVSALHSIFRKTDEFDIVVIIRGGGAATDLDCFDNYNVASHVAQFPLPVITGIGHERDETIVDMVANTRLKTPTAAAEFLISGIRRYEETIDELAETVNGLAVEILDEETGHLDDLTDRIRQESSILLTEFQNRFQFLSNNFHLSARNSVRNMTVTTNQLTRMLRQILGNQINLENEKLRRITENLTLVDINAVLKRGFSITRINGKLVKNSAQVNPGDRLSTELGDGNIESVVSN